jgi:hypothetical protein
MTTRGFRPTSAGFIKLLIDPPLQPGARHPHIRRKKSFSPARLKCGIDQSECARPRRAPPDEKLQLAAGLSQASARLLLENFSRTKQDSQLRNAERIDLGQTRIAGIETSRVRINKPDVPHTPDTIFLKFLAHYGQAIVR